MRKSRKILLGFALSGLLSLGSVMLSFAGEWKVDPSNGWSWYQNDDGSCTKNDWQQIDGKWYHFDENGYVQLGWWRFPTSYTYGTGDFTTTEMIDEWYYLSRETGEMVTSGSWEGGYISDNGILHIDEVYPTNGKVIYCRVTENYEGSLGWKVAMLTEWDNKLSDYLDYGSFSMDYQLPSNWSDECPLPLMTAAIDYTCFNHWGGAGIVNWRDSWRVDENNVIHIEAEYFEYAE